MNSASDNGLSSTAPSTMASGPACECMGLDEVRKLVKALGIDASEEDIELMFRESDADGGGSIDDSEFTDLVERLQKKAGRSIAGKIRWRKAIQFVVRSLQSESQKVRESSAVL